MKNKKFKIIEDWKFEIGNSSLKRSGFTMVETLIAIGVLGIFFAAIAFILQQVLINVGESRVRATALSLAQTKMEIIRNLPYNEVGTIGGIPSGPLEQNEEITINTLVFTINTSIIYVDDPFDQEAPNDIINTDYKRARVEITWGGSFPSRSPITLVTNIAPKGLETVTTGGTLFIRVFNAGGQPVSNAVVQIDNTQVNPQIHTQTLTSSSGLVVLPGSPPCVACYQITVTKTGFSTDRTYTTTEVANPLQPLGTVIEGQTSQLSFTIDTTSTLVIRSVSPAPNYGIVTNVQFTLKGAKIIGYDTQDEPLYKYSFSTNTGGGSVSIPGLEWDSYTLDFTNSAHNMAGSNPVLPIALSPGSNQTISLVAVSKTNTSLLVLVKNGANELQASASANLTSSGISYDVTKVTAATDSADFGQTFFGGLSAGNYELKVNLSGYQEATASLSLTGINEEIVTLNTAE